MPSAADEVLRFAGPVSIFPFVRHPGIAKDERYESSDLSLSSEMRAFLADARRLQRFLWRLFVSDELLLGELFDREHLHVRYLRKRRLELVRIISQEGAD